MANERISPTAWLAAYQRTLADIPLASAIFHELEALRAETRAAPELAGVDALKAPQSGVMWEARYKLVNHLLAAHPVRQVLELAAGFSPRGLNQTGDAAITYVELDLPGVIQDKQRIVSALLAQGRLAPRPNFHLAAGDALNLADVQAAARYFAAGPTRTRPTSDASGASVAVVNEGLLLYLDYAQRAALASNIHALLEQFGGVWITPDIDVQLAPGAFGAAAGAMPARLSQIAALTGVDVLKNRFESEDAARAFFEGQGFQVERHSFLEVADQLVLPRHEALAPKALERSVAFALRVERRHPRGAAGQM
jgi:O-methyltransferase involved in polyketide biosynthesis